MRRALSLLLVCLLPLCAGCAGPTFTIRELGQPAFEPLLGSERLEGLEEEQTKGFDAFDPARVEDEGDHRLALRFWPLGDATLIAIEVRARGLGRLRLSDLAAAIYPATLAEASAFEAQGTLPAGEPLVYSQESERDGESRVLVLRLPRDQVPPGCEAFAVPVLSRFEDGWVHVQFYRTAIPEPLRRETPEEAQRRAAANAPQAQEGPAPPAEGPAESPASPAEGPAPASPEAEQAAPASAPQGPGQASPPGD